MKTRTILNILLAGIFTVVVATVTMIAVRGDASARARRDLPALGAVPEFALVEAAGSPLRRADLAGKVWIASFIFTRCAEVCPAMMRQQVRLQKELPVRDDLVLVSFSVDPDYDTPAVLTQYAGIFGVERSRWLFATGDKKLIYHIALDGFRLSANDADPATEMPILHSTKLALVDRRGAIRGYYDSSDEAALAQLVLDLKRVLGERS